MSDALHGNDFRFPRMSRGMKKLIIGYLVIFVMLVGTLAALELVQRTGEGDLRRQAAGVTGGANVTFNTLSAADRILIPGKSGLTVPISIASNQQSVTAADIDVDFDTNLLNVTNLSTPNYFGQTSNSFGSLDTYTLLVTPAVGRIAIGAPCDRCYLGASPTPGGPTVMPCGITNPQCYPKPTGSSSIAANLVVQAKANVVGKTNLTFVPFSATGNTGTAVAGIGSDTDVVSTLGPPMGICVAYDFDKNNITNTGDILRVSTRYNLVPGQTNWDPLYDANNDSRITVADILPVSTRYNSTCTP